LQGLTIPQRPSPEQARNFSPREARQGKTDEARTMLANIYGCFSEGFDTTERAKAPLDPPNA